MAHNAFIDCIDILVRAGHGGAGSVHFRREPYIPQGGPDGGDGGKGGNITLEGNRNLTNLIAFRYSKRIVATNGTPGARNHRSGANGANNIMQVPLGTTIKEEGRQIAEITTHGERIIVAQGGIGGKGNAHFKRADRQAPRYAQPGRSGEEKQLTLELKTIADIGLVGYPNAGKSTLLGKLTAANPKIGSYPFTTLAPNLGVLTHHTEHIIIADIPGIIEGAAKGKGLGIQFLRHIERTRILLFLVAADDIDPLATYKNLREELHQYNPLLNKLPHCLILTKTDLLSPPQASLVDKSLKQYFYLPISSHHKKGLSPLKDKITQLIRKSRKEHQP